MEPTQGLGCADRSRCGLMCEPEKTTPHLSGRFFVMMSSEESRAQSQGRFRRASRTTSGLSASRKQRCPVATDRRHSQVKGKILCSTKTKDSSSRLRQRSFNRSRTRALSMIARATAWTISPACITSPVMRPSLSPRFWRLHESKCGTGADHHRGLRIIEQMRLMLIGKDKPKREV